MLITVAICTWNRAKLLDRTLAQMGDLEVPAGVEWELLVINNNCTDDTESVLAHYRERLPLRWQFEPQPGKSHALNRAIAHAAGELILWTDDDVLVDRRWLAGYAGAAETCPKAAFFGGPVQPWFEGDPPPWLPAVWHKVQSAYAVRDFGPESRPCSMEVMPFGANFAVRTSIQARYPYDPALGPRPGSEIRGEEAAVIAAMLRDGLEGVWVPQAQVRHFIPRHRQTIAYLRGWFEGYGEGLGRESEARDAATLWGYPRWAVRGAIEGELRYRAGRLLSSPQQWINHLIRSSTCRGYLRAWGREQHARAVD